MDSHIYTQHFKTPYGALLLGDYNEQLCLCDWTYRRMRTNIDGRIQDHLNSDYQEKHTPLLTETVNQLNAYFQQELETFDLPILLAGSDFQKKVWSTLLKIPYGKTTSYLDLSRQLQNEKAIRAVSSANGANAISIIVPCHRVIGSNGDLVGYAGGLTAKKKLLMLENKTHQGELFN